MPAHAPSLLTVIASAIALWATYIVWLCLIKPSFSKLRNIPGPRPTSFLWGNVQRILDEEPGVAHLEWTDKYGGVVKYRGAFGEDRVMFTDPVALNHILNAQAYAYPKPNEVRGSLARILGRGVLFAEGDDHRRQRKIMNPSFGPGQLRDIAPIFMDKSNELREQWRQKVAQQAIDSNSFASKAAEQEYKDSKTKDSNPEAVLDISRWLSRVTLDVIGTAGFGYEFGSINGERNELAEAFGKMLSPPGGRSKPTILNLLAGRYIQAALGYFPVDLAKYVPNERLRTVARMFETMETRTKEIVASKKAQVKAEGLDSKRKDLMTLLLRSNLGDSKVAMSDEELQGQMTTMLLAGHETSSTTLTWLLWMLARKPEIQDKLRAEVRSAKERTGQDDLHMDDINSLEYMDAVVREILRLESPVSITIRTSAQDDMVPLSKPVQGRQGSMSSVPISKGTTIMIPIVAVNRDPAVWGEDAHEFKPERWSKQDIGAGVGVYSRMLTFLAGPRACIGYKFAILEIKSILAVLIDEFEFEERSPGMVIERRSQIVTRPLIVGEESQGTRMPLRIRLAKRS